MRRAVTITPRNGGKTLTHAGDVLSILQKRSVPCVIVRDANMLAQVRS